MLPERDHGAVVALQGPLGCLDRDLDALWRDDALFARLLPRRARLALGRLEIVRVEREVGVDVLLRPRVRPGLYRLQDLLAAGRRSGRLTFGRLGLRRGGRVRRGLGRRSHGGWVGGRRDRGRAADQLAYQRQLVLGGRVRRVELQRLVVRLARELGVDVTEVLVRGGVAWMRADGHFQLLSRLLVLALARIQYRQIVVGLGQLGIVL